MSKLGDQLRAQRERKAITLTQAAVDTRIREKFLMALEQGDYQLLPGAVYTKGFLRNYAEYLDLPADELVLLYQRERGQPEAPTGRGFEPYRPVMRRSLIFTPVVIVPVFIVAGVLLFAGYLYYQFSVFASPPRLEVLDPPSDQISQSSELLVRGITVPDGRVTVRIFPGPDVFGDIRPGSDGRFATTVPLRPGANHLEVEVLDAAGKVFRVSRTIQYTGAIASAPSAPILTLDQPSDGATFTNIYVAVTGRVDRTVTSVQVNNLPVTINPDGTFQARYYKPAGPQSFRVVARNSAGDTAEVARNVLVVYSAAVVNVSVLGGDTWLLATVDGTDVAGTGRVYREGETLVFTGREVRLRAGNAAAAQVSYNGQPSVALGRQGEVVERIYRAQ